MKFGNRWVVIAKIGAGSFGTVYKGIDLKTSKEVAIKVESRKAKLCYLFTESRVLQKLKGRPGFSRMIWYGNTPETNVLIMELLG
jgi:serine/threonine protein kinase